MAEDEHAMSVAIVLKSPRVGGKFEVSVQRLVSRPGIEDAIRRPKALGPSEVKREV